MNSILNVVLRSWRTAKRSSFARHAWQPVAEPDDPKWRVPTSAMLIYLRSFRDALAIREILLSEKHVVVVGSGFLGAEVSSFLTSSGAKLSLLSRDKVIWQDLLDPETAQWLTDSYLEAGIQLLLNENLNGFEGKTVIKNIQTKSGMRFPAGLAVVAIGTEPNLQLVANTPLSSPSGCPVNEYLETDEKGIYAVGDIALYPDRIYGGAKRVTNVEMARLQGLTAGANLTGRKRQKFESVPTCSSQVLGYAFRFRRRFQHAASARRYRREQRETKLCRTLSTGRNPHRRGALQSEPRRSRRDPGRG